jgi:hypothetical protein
MNLGVFAQPVRNVCIIVFSGFVLLSAQVPGAVSPDDANACKQTVTSFCTSWKSLKFDSMYVKLSSDGMGQMEKMEFTRTYAPAADRSGMVSGFTVGDEVTSTENGLLVKVTMTFEKDKTPNLINGEHRFYLVKDSEVWKIKTIVAPVPVPSAEGGTGGSHPGE